jgi:hypothetical protein
MNSYKICTNKFPINSDEYRDEMIDVLAKILKEKYNDSTIDMRNDTNFIKKFMSDNDGTTIDVYNQVDTNFFGEMNLVCFWRPAYDFPEKGGFFTF